MPRKIGNVDRSTLLAAPLPQATKSYTVISHSYAINTILKTLDDAGFTVEAEEYRCIDNAQVASGSFIINYNDDPELNLVYAFSNSYNKQLRFKSAVGVMVKTNNAYMISNINQWNRKHTGSADQEAEELIKDHISHAKDYFEQLRLTKEAMKNIPVSDSEFGCILGELFIHNFLTVDQFSAAAKEFKAPSHTYAGVHQSLWACYNYILLALRQTHPSKWLPTQAAVHMYITSKFNVASFTFDDDEQDDPETNEPETFMIGEEEVTAIPTILEQVPAQEVLPGYGPKSEETKPDLLEEEEVENPNQMTIDQVIEADNLKTEATMTEEFIKDHCGLCEKKYDPADKICIKCMEVDQQPTDKVEEPQADQTPVEKSEDNEDVYFLAKDFPGVSVGEFFEDDGIMFEVLAVEMINNQEMLWCNKVVPIATQEEQLPEPEVPTTEGPEEITLPSVKEVVKEESIQEIVDELPTAPEPEPEATPETQLTPEEIAIRNVIAKELFELYDEEKEFTYTIANNQYNIALASGETITLSATYIKNKM
jgi:hypothetical protein